MDDIKHTPGPWWIEDGTYGYDTTLGVCGGDTGFCVAGLVADIAELKPEVEANARLIAAAPELLEALKEARGALKHVALFDADDMASEDQGPLDAVRAKVEAAIAKAEGRS